MKLNTRRKAIIAFLAAGAAAVGGLTLAAGSASAAGSDAPLVTAKSRKIPGQYIVVLKDGKGADVARRNSVTAQRVYSTALNGFAAKLSAAQLAKLRKDPSVKYVEEDATVSINDKPAPPPTDKDAPRAGVATAPHDDNGVRTKTVQPNPTWGLDRVDQRNLPLNNAYKYTGTGAGVTAYVIDTGLYTGHSLFGGRARGGFTAIDDGHGTDDCHGHGTHVAGTIGSSTYGVAKGVSLVGVRVLDCSGSGTWSGVVAGIDWVTYNHDGPSVANMSLGGGYSQAVNDAVAASTLRGVVHVVAAGNSNDNACSYSPASTVQALTVAATDNTDTRAWFSNYGSCVDLFAPGVDITSTYIGSPTAITTMSGTSMASPHVAGLTALYLEANPYATATTANATLKSEGAWGVVTNPGTGTPNRFARKWNATLTAVGESKYEPDGSSWTQPAGYIQAWLVGTPSSDPDLYLEQWNGSAWVTVASSTTRTNRERVVYNGTAGTYRLRIYGYAGTGTYDVWTNRPN